jgi:hypothetical protein
MPFPIQSINAFFSKTLRGKSRWIVVVLVTALVAGAVGWQLLWHGHRRPPSIFDAPVDDVFGYLGTADFNRLPLNERLDFIRGLLKRFAMMNQSESVVASSFLAGLTGPASEKLMNNARILGKDIFVQGAAEFMTLQTEQERNAYLDRWIVRWVKFVEESRGGSINRTDEEILTSLGKQARRDLSRGINIDAEMAQQMMDFWDRDVASVASPKEQAQIFQFGPAVRQRILTRGQ